MFYINDTAKCMSMSIVYITHITVQWRKYFKYGQIYLAECALPCAGRAGLRSMWAYILAQVVRYRV